MYALDASSAASTAFVLPRVISGGGRVRTLNAGYTFVSEVIRAWQLCGLAFTRSRSCWGDGTTVGPWHRFF